MSYGISIIVEPDPDVDRWDDVATQTHLNQLATWVGEQLANATITVTHKPSYRPDVAPPDAYVNVELDYDSGILGAALIRAAEVSRILENAGFAISRVDVQDWQYIVPLA